MPWVLRNLASTTREKLNRVVKVPCPEVEKKWIKDLAKLLELNEETELAPLFPESFCKEARPKGVNLTVRDVLLSIAVQEPDLGMDKNLPDYLDAKQDRLWMGGKTGPNSQGFRHMFFSGWNIEYPLRTFQIPLRPLGQAVQRAQILAEASRDFFKKNQLYEGARTLAWSLHYIQDLSQPYHTAQIPYLKFIQWRNALHALPRIGTAFQLLVEDTSHAISNYHYAYEQWVSSAIRETASSQTTNNLKTCLDELEFSTQADDEVIHAQTPEAIALEVSRKSKAIAWEIGEQSLLFFGSALFDKEVNLPLGRGTPNYSQLQKNQSLDTYRKQLESLTCESLERGIRGSRKVIEWAL